MVAPAPPTARSRHSCAALQRVDPSIPTSEGMAVQAAAPLVAPQDKDSPAVVWVEAAEEEVTVRPARAAGPGVRPAAAPGSAARVTRGPAAVVASTTPVQAAGVAVATTAAAGAAGGQFFDAPGGGGGGGGGSSYVAGVSSPQSESGVNPGNGYVEIAQPGTIGLPLYGGPTSGTQRTGGGGGIAPGTCDCGTGDPVDIATGDFIESATDASIPTYGPSLTFTCTYSMRCRPKARQPHRLRDLSATAGPTTGPPRSR